MSQSEFAQWMNPVLRALRELGGSARPQEVVERVARNEKVPDSVLDKLNPAGGERCPNQVHWARYYLVSLFGELEFGLRAVTTYEVDEALLGEYRSSRGVRRQHDQYYLRFRQSGSTLSFQRALLL